MSFLEDALKRALPTAKAAEPIAIAVGSVVLGRMLNGPAAAGSVPAPQAGQGNAGQGDLVNGLGGLIGKLQQAGLGDAVNSWIGNGQNAPIDANQLGAALGKEAVSELARHTGLDEGQLMAGLSQVLPVVIDKLTPHGRLPTQQEVTQAG
jgi:uncharacterized protein YidB (DUF937 family)